MNGAYGRRRYGFSSTRKHLERPAGQARGQPARAGFVQMQDGRGREARRRIEVAAGGDTHVVERDQVGGERLGVARLRVGGGEGRLNVPVLGGMEPHAGPFALDDDPRRDGLNPAGR